MEQPPLEDVASWIREARSLAVLTGAGISTESGIPDFRGPKGLWTKDPEAEKKSHIQNWMGDPQWRKSRWKAYLESPTLDAKPNPGHYALVDLEKRANLELLVTQNVDSLHLEAGNSPERLVEIHGTTRDVMCMECGDRAAMERALERVRSGEEDPPCRTCGGVLKAATISFGQGLLPEDLDRSFEAARRCDLLLCVGTLLSVYPIAHMADIALQTRARLVIINAEATAYDVHASAAYHDQIGDILPKLVELV